MTKRVIAIAYHFVLELMAGYLLIFLYYIGKNTFPPVYHLTLLGMGGMILFSWMIGKLANKGIWLYLVVVLPLLIFIGYKSGLSPSLTVSLGLVIFWRGVSTRENYSYWSHSLMLLWSFSFGIIGIIYSSMTGYIYQTQMISMLVLLVVLIFADSYFTKWSSLSADKSKFSVLFVKVLLALSGVGLVIAFSLKYIQLVFFGFFQVVAKVVSSIILPLYSFIEYLIGLIGNKTNDIEYKPVEPLQGNNDFQPHSYSFGANFIYFLLFLAVAAFIYYVIRRKLQQEAIAIDSIAAVEITDGAITHKSLWFSNRWGKPPEDLIRKEIFQLEKYAHKLKVGRHPNETLEEWVKRAELSLSEECIKIYYKVRYGGDAASSRDIAMVKSEADTVKKQLKERKRLEKKSV
jgi:hypothetical protein